jgi:RNA recognition motif-containing protein
MFHCYAGDDDCRTLFVFNLPFDATDQEINDKFKGYQSATAKLQHRRGCFCGRATIEMRSADEAARAISDLHGTEIRGRAMSVCLERRDGQEENMLNNLTKFTETGKPGQLLRVSVPSKKLRTYCRNLAKELGLTCATDTERAPGAQGQRSTYFIVTMTASTPQSVSTSVANHVLDDLDDEDDYPRNLQSNAPPTAPQSDPEERQRLGDRLYCLIKPLHPDAAGKLTGMLLEQPLERVVDVINDPQLFEHSLTAALRALNESGSNQSEADQV